MFEGIRFFWNATRGNRLRPWRSEYLCWRLETFTGKSSKMVDSKDFVALVLNEKGQMIRFLRWLTEMHEYSRSGADR